MTDAEKGTAAFPVTDSPFLDDACLVGPKSTARRDRLRHVEKDIQDKWTKEKTFEARREG
jgi:hypothetical protein